MGIIDRTAGVADVFADFYEHLFQVLKDTVEITGGSPPLVPTTNIKPSFDPELVPAGNLIEYGWPSSAIDRRRGSGSGTFIIRIRAVDNKDVAQQILTEIRKAVTARTISRANVATKKIVVQKFKENVAVSDEEVDESGRYVVTAPYDVRLVSLDLT